MSNLRRTRRLFLGAVAIVGALLSAPAAAQTSADVQLEVSGTAPTDIGYGQWRTIDFTVTNLGPSVATGLTLTSLGIDDELTYAIEGCTPVTEDVPVPCTIGDGTIYDEPDLDTPVNQKSFSIVVELPADAVPETCDAGRVLDDLSVEISADTDDPDLDNNAVDLPGLEVGPAWDLSIVLTAPESADIGDTIEVGAIVSNAGPCDATEVSVNDWWWAATSQTLGFIEATGDCTEDTSQFGENGCYWDVVEVGTPKTWTIQYEVLDLPTGLMQTGDPVYMDVVSNGAPYYGVAEAWLGRGIYPELDFSNDSFQSKTIVKKSQSGCSTGDLGGALGLLLVAVPFLRRRRKS